MKRVHHSVTKPLVIKTMNSSMPSVVVQMTNHQSKTIINFVHFLLFATSRPPAITRAR